MLELLTIGMVAFIAGLSGFIGATYALKRFDFYGLLVDSFDALLADQENLTKLYGLGQILGRGLGDGVGLGKLTKKGGKIFGIPSELVLPILQKVGIIPKGEQTTSASSGENPFAPK